MGTISIHHHLHDTFAAEAIGGMLLGCGRVRLCCHHPGQHAFSLAPPIPATETLVVWTDTAWEDHALNGVVRTLMVTRRRFLVLRFGDTPLPAGLADNEVWPLFDHGVAWRAYRADLRARLGFGEETTQPHTPRALLDHLDVLPAADFPLLPALVAGGVLLWAIVAR